MTNVLIFQINEWARKGCRRTVDTNCVALHFNPAPEDLLTITGEYTPLAVADGKLLRNKIMN